MAGITQPGVDYLGDLERAEPLLTWLERQGSATGRRWTLATAARCRGLLLAARGDTQGAVQVLDEALRHHQQLAMPFELGRTLLVAGQLQRRAKRKRLARQHLEQALGTIREMAIFPRGAAPEAQGRQKHGRAQPLRELRRRQVSWEYGTLAAEVYELDKPVGSPFADVAYHTDLLADVRGRILESATGTGRILIPLLEAGHQVEGLDSSPEMLAFCRQHCRDRGLDPVLREADMTIFVQLAAYEAVIIPAGSIALLDGRKATLQALTCFS